MKLIPFVSTHVKLLIKSRSYSAGKIYPIVKWYSVSGHNHYEFIDDLGAIRQWFCWDDDPGVEDASFEGNLEKILE